MTDATLDALARELANDPGDEAALAAFVDLLKDAPAEQAMAAVRSLLIMRGYAAIRDEVLGRLQKQQGQMLPERDHLPSFTIRHEVRTLP